MSATRTPIAFLFDVDNTLLDNDRVRRDLVEATNHAVAPSGECGSGSSMRRVSPSDRSGQGMAEVILVQPLGDSRCRVNYTGELPPSDTLLRMTHRLPARPAVERIVRAHLADLARRGEGEGGRKRQ